MDKMQIRQGEAILVCLRNVNSLEGLPRSSNWSSLDPTLLSYIISNYWSLRSCQFAEPSFELQALTNQWSRTIFSIWKAIPTISNDKFRFKIEFKL